MPKYGAIAILIPFLFGHVTAGMPNEGKITSFQSQEGISDRSRGCGKQGKERQPRFIEGEVLNLGTGPLTVEISDVSLTSSAGIGNLRTAAPPWPWTVQPNQTQVIELQYERPDASTVLLTLLGYSFEIQGL